MPRGCARRATLGLLLAIALLGLAGEAWARVGGGHSFGGGGFGGGGYRGGSHGRHGGQLIGLLIRLCLQRPAIGIPLTTAIVGLWIYLARRQAQREQVRGQLVDQAHRSAHHERLTRERKPAAQRLRAEDPYFSEHVLRDFVHLLYARFHQARGQGEYTGLEPYIRPELLRTLKERRPSTGGVRDVVLGSLFIMRIEGFDQTYRRLRLKIEANYSEGQPERRYYVREIWVLRRRAGARSRDPDALDDLRCPGCGAAVELKPDGTCAYCARAVTRGECDWQIDTMESFAKDPLNDAALAVQGDEPGTQLPTVRAPDLAARRREFTVRYPGFEWRVFTARAQAAFLALQAAWSERDWKRARPYQTDPLFEAHRDWIERYRRAGLTNKLDDVKIEKMELCKIEQDAFFEAVTVRICATMKDYTLRADGALVCGSQTADRRCSEYWTFIRRTGFDPARRANVKGCPSCGAATDDINQAGICAYCETKITRGDFDWVLSLIEQDEAYAG